MMAMAEPPDPGFPAPGPDTAITAAPPRGRQLITVTLPGEIDLTNAGQVHAALTRALRGGTAVVADAAGTTFCDCAGVRALIRAHRQAAAAGTQLRVASATSPGVRRILELTGAGQALDTYPTLAAALDGQPARHHRPDPASSGHRRQAPVPMLNRLTAAALRRS